MPKHTARQIANRVLPRLESRGDSQAHLHIYMYVREPPSTTTASFTNHAD